MPAAQERAQAAPGLAAERERLERARAQRRVEEEGGCVGWADAVDVKREVRDVAREGRRLSAGRTNGPERLVLAVNFPDDERRPCSRRMLRERMNESAHAFLG